MGTLRDVVRYAAVFVMFLINLQVWNVVKEAPTVQVELERLDEALTVGWCAYWELERTAKGPASWQDGLLFLTFCWMLPMALAVFYFTAGFACVSEVSDGTFLQFGPKKQR